MASTWLLPRRTFLRGVSASIALPFLDAMVPANPPLAHLAKPPVRLGWFYVPNGVVLDRWLPAPGRLGELPAILKPLDAVKERVLVLSDLAAAHCYGEVGAHEPTGGGILTGGKCAHAEEPAVVGPSIDQLAARQCADRTAIDCLTLGVDPGGRGDHGYSGTYMSHISWRNATTPAALELNPKELYDRLFGGRTLRAPSWDKPARPAAGKAAAGRRSADEVIGSSILDQVREEARRLMNGVGANDRAKLEGYLDGIRAIERRLDRVQEEGAEHPPESAAKPRAAGAGAPPDLMIPSKPGIPKDYAEHANLLLDILTMAFWTDTTRVATFMFSFEKSWRSYPEIGVPEDHHHYSHHQNKPENLEALAKINTHHLTLFARFLGNLARIKEGDGTLLDHVAFMYGSGISDGDKHNHENLPILLAGGCGGALTKGMHVALGKKTPICNLYLAMMAMGGLQLDSFGDSTGRLALA